MKRWFSWHYIKLKLFRMGFYKINTFEEKIKFLLESKIDLYEAFFRSKYGIFICKDIKEYIIDLDDIDKFELKDTYYPYKNITNDTLFNKTYNKWATDDGRFIDQVEEFKLWLTLAKSVHNKLTIGAKLPTMNIYYNNSLKLKPYIINIENIVNHVFNYIIDMEDT
jgi:hypothetical protein